MYDMFVHKNIVLNNISVRFHTQTFNTLADVRSYSCPIHKNILTPLTAHTDMYSVS